MVISWEGRSFPFDLQAGDVLFIGGCLPMDRSRRLPFEHVAISAEDKTIFSASDLMNLSVYGMPETVTSPPQTTGAIWLGRPWLGTAMGSAHTIWNFICREQSIDLFAAKEIGFYLALTEGTFDCRYEPTFRVDPHLRGPIGTNCLGYVCSIFEYFGIKIVSHDQPTYPGPYNYPDTNNRTFPSPGHLAHVLSQDLTASYPWKASDSSEAEKYSRVDQTISDFFSAGYHLVV